MLAAVWPSLRMSFYAMLTSIVFGTLVAWVLVRDRVSGQKSGQCAGRSAFCAAHGGHRHCAGHALCAQRLAGCWFAPFDIKIAFTPIGIWIALVFVSLPFIVRAVQPCVEELPAEYEASADVGAGCFTALRRVLLPEIMPALLHRLGHDVCPRHRRVWLGDFLIAGSIPYGVGNFCR